jgi:hypothetical protein
MIVARKNKHNAYGHSYIIYLLLIHCPQSVFFVIVIKSRMKWVQHLEYVGQNTNVCRTWVREKSMQEKDHLQDHSQDGRILKQLLQAWMGGCELASSAQDWDQ